MYASIIPTLIKLVPKTTFQPLSLTRSSTIVSGEKSSL
jgi:hypothetical protein